MALLGGSACDPGPADLVVTSSISANFAFGCFRPAALYSDGIGFSPRPGQRRATQPLEEDI